MINDHCQPADHTIFATNNDAATNSLALELDCYEKPKAPCVGCKVANTVSPNHLTERLHHYRTNFIQRNWIAYTSSNYFDLHKRFCGEWLVM